MHSGRRFKRLFSDSWQPLTPKQLGEHWPLSLRLAWLFLSLWVSLDSHCWAIFKLIQTHFRRDISLTANADKVFPHFIAYHLPPGISGLVVAAMFAAAMSSIDSGVNSITAVVVTDLLHRRPANADTDVASVPGVAALPDGTASSPNDPPQTNSQPDSSVVRSQTNSQNESTNHLATARWMAFAIGAIVVVGSSFMGAIPGNITAVTTKTANLLATPIFALFFLRAVRAVCKSQRSHHWRGLWNNNRRPDCLLRTDLRIGCRPESASNGSPQLLLP